MSLSPETPVEHGVIRVSPWLYGLWAVFWSISSFGVTWLHAWSGEPASLSLLAVTVSCALFNVMGIVRPRRIQRLEGGILYAPVLERPSFIPWSQIDRFEIVRYRCNVGEILGVRFVTLRGAGQAMPTDDACPRLRGFLGLWIVADTVIAVLDEWLLEARLSPG